MAWGRRPEERQQEFWIATGELPRSAGHPFYQRLEQLLVEGDFDGYVETLCENYYAEGGRPSIPPGRYFRMLFVGYFEGIDSQRGIAWRCSDSLSLRDFLGLEPRQSSPDHSSLTKIRQRLPLEIHEQVFTFVLELAAQQGLLRGRTVADKGYHKAETLVELSVERSIRSYIPEPDRAHRRTWKDKPAEQQAAVYANRRRVRGERSKRLQKLRNEYVERSFAHVCQTGGARRIWLRGLEKVRKHYLVQVAARNLGLILRKLFGIGTPRGLQGAFALVGLLYLAIQTHILPSDALWTDRCVRVTKVLGTIIVRLTESPNQFKPAFFNGLLRVLAGTRPVHCDNGARRLRVRSRTG